jgi:tetratricopeptide (TPR) repeat protein
MKISSIHTKITRIYMHIRLSKANAIAGIAGAIFGGLGLSVAILAFCRDLIDFKLPGISEAQANDNPSHSASASYKPELDEYGQYIALNLKDADAYYHRGRLYHYKLDNFKAALADYDQAIAINPQYDKALHDRGRLKGEVLDDLGGAYIDLSKAIAINPKYAEAYHSRGNLRGCLKSQSYASRLSIMRIIAI